MIITISREFGSGGREQGKRLSEALGIPCYDNEIIQMIAEEHINRSTSSSMRIRRQNCSGVLNVRPNEKICPLRS